MHTYVLCSIIYNNQDLETAQVSISRWVDKKAVVHLHNGLLLSGKKKKEGILIICVIMDTPREHYAKWNKLAREWQVLYDFPHMWNLMNKIN